MASVLRDRVGQETVLTPGAEGGPAALAKLISQALEDCLKAHETHLTVNLERINTISGGSPKRAWAVPFVFAVWDVSKVSLAVAVRHNTSGASFSPPPPQFGQLHG